MQHFEAKGDMREYIAQTECASCAGKRMERKRVLPTKKPFPADITSAVFYIMTEKDDILVKTQISDRVKLITDKFGLRTREDRISLEDWKMLSSYIIVDKLLQSSI